MGTEFPHALLRCSKKVDGLRVADASVIPDAVSGNTQAREGMWSFKSKIKTGTLGFYREE